MSRLLWWIITPRQLRRSGFIVLLASLAAAQEPAVRLAKPLQHEISVQLKLVQVYVSDGRDRPVSWRHAHRSTPPHLSGNDQTSVSL